MQEPTGETPVVPEAEQSKLITLPPEFFPARTEEVAPLRFDQTESYPPRTGNVNLNLTPDQTAAKLAEQAEAQRLVQAAADAAVQTAESIEDAKNKPL